MWFFYWQCELHKLTSRLQSPLAEGSHDARRQWQEGRADIGGRQLRPPRISGSACLFAIQNERLGILQITGELECPLFCKASWSSSPAISTPTTMLSVQRVSSRLSSYLFSSRLDGYQGSIFYLGLIDGPIALGYYFGTHHSHGLFSIHLEIR